MPGWLLKFSMSFLRMVMTPKGLAKQARKPSGWYGKYIAQPMFLSGNAALNQLIFNKLDLSSNDVVLEVGFGPGALLGQIAEKVNRSNNVFGLDFSPTMLAEAQRRNRNLIESGLLHLQQGSSSNMPYTESYFSKICCSNILYFWQPPEPHLSEILRCLQPGGQLVMGFRSADQINAMQLDNEVFARYSDEELESLLKRVGFSDVAIIHQSAEPLDSYVAIATKSV
ncbi:class I SAM-dependent methyltransferase [Thiomicrorhabdus sp. ZW0627]|uniref:class I SAM-dependent methyltransferase n=1 Tax=Thiomicrorhabdus sp. ZW0627 TaxID=3039774 RepID=UPI0024365390|nr:class I SAM-dependent methyltransferase [Thiomicrorhabdus sp. ZW0627]MDG6774411.1 class I SAM-dependent methyltransferase [Thiomicrorhabdus sp. ZW0627]